MTRAKAKSQTSVKYSSSPKLEERMARAWLLWYKAKEETLSPEALSHTLSQWIAGETTLLVDSTDWKEALEGKEGG